MTSIEHPLIASGDMQAFAEELAEVVEYEHDWTHDQWGVPNQVVYVDASNFGGPDDGIPVWRDGLTERHKLPWVAQLRMVDPDMLALYDVWGN